MNSDVRVIGLGLLGVVLITMPVIAPPTPVLEHDSGMSVRSANASELAAQSYAIYQYENLSDRAREIYRDTLRKGGQHRVPLGEGASEFQYLDREALRASEDEPLRGSAETAVVIVRPTDSSLPPADERLGQDRYDAMTTREIEPAVGSGAYVPQFAALLVGVNVVCLSGYLLFGRANQEPSQIERNG